MRSTLLFAAVAMCVAAPVAAQAPGSAAEAVAIAAVARKYEAAFNKADAKGVAATYTADAVFTEVDGAVRSGRAAIEASTAASLAAQFKGATLVIMNEPAVFLKPDVAWGRGGFEVKAAGKMLAKGLYLVVFTKAADGWHLAAHQSMVPFTPPPPPPAAPAKKKP